MEPNLVNIHDQPLRTNDNYIGFYFPAMHQSQKDYCDNNYDSLDFGRWRIPKKGTRKLKAYITQTDIGRANQETSRKVIICKRCKLFMIFRFANAVPGWTSKRFWTNSIMCFIKIQIWEECTA